MEVLTVFKVTLHHSLLGGSSLRMKWVQRIHHNWHIIIKRAFSISHKQTDMGTLIFERGGKRERGKRERQRGKERKTLDVVCVGDILEPGYYMGFTDMSILYKTVKVTTHKLIKFTVYCMRSFYTIYQYIQYGLKPPLTQKRKSYII